VTKPRLKKSVLTAVALVVLGAGTAAAVLARSGRDVTTTSAEAYEFYEKGLEDERRMYYKDALASYAKALELDPHFTMATLRLAGNMAGRDRERARSLVQCASRNPGHLNEREKLFLAIVEADVLERDVKKSGELVREFVKRFPDDPEGYFRLAGVLMHEGKTEEMLATYERLLSLDPNQATAYNALGYHYIGRRDFVKGEDYLKRYRFLAPDQANPYDSLGELYANTGRYDEAEEHLKRALQIRPDFVPAVGHLGTLEVGRGNADAAVAYFRRAVEMSESWKDRLMFVGAAAMALLDAGRPDDALAMLNEAAAVPPALSPKEDFFFRHHVIRSRAVVLALAGRAAEAEAEMALLPAVPGDLETKETEGLERGLLGARAALAGARGNTEEAVASLRAFLADEKVRDTGDFPYYPNTFRLRVRLADALVTLGRSDEAREELRPVLAVNPRFAPALGVIARIEGIEGRAGDVKGSAGR
jgi:tetratricopeptide (TPR) repeat protein